MDRFELISPFAPKGDQPAAIEKLTKSFAAGRQHQCLLGVTGSGKTFTMANVIANLNTPTLVISHNKTLAAQLYEEFRELFPNNAVEYFVSYYEHYRSERVDNLPGGGTYTYYRCIIVRGNGWQKDTLPAEEIKTALIQPAGESRPSYEDCVGP